LVTSLLHAVNVVISRKKDIYFITDTMARCCEGNTEQELVRYGWTMFNVLAMRRVSVNVDTVAGVYMTTIILTMSRYLAISTQGENMPVRKMT